MRVGVSLPWLIEPDAGEPFAKVLELALAAEAAGFDFAALGQHSFKSFKAGIGAPAACFVALGALATGTSRLRLMAGVFPVPLYNPVDVAEQAATVDQISAGRLIFGAGLGTADHEFAGHGVDKATRAARADEGLRLIKQAWATGSFAFSGEYFTVPDVPTDPLPVQRPRPPIWVAGTSAQTVELAARLADGWITGVTTSLHENGERAALYRDLCDQGGAPRGVVCPARMAWTAPTREQVEREWLGGAIDGCMAYRPMRPDAADPDGMFARIASGKRPGLAEFAHNYAIAGTPDDCVGQIRCWQQETGASVMMLQFGGPETPFEVRKHVITMFGREVIAALDA